MYGFWWYKPYDIQVPIRVPCKKLNEEEEREYSKIKINAVSFDHAPYSLNFWNFWNFYELMKRFPAYYDQTFKNGSLLISVVFGGIHVAAWGNSLPTALEGKLWKVSSILSTVITPTFFYIIRSHGRFQWPRQSFLGRLRLYTSLSVGVVYVLLRLILVIEPFVALRSAPRGVYKNINWMNFLPHMF